MAYAYRLHGGPCEGWYTLPLALGEWLVLFLDERKNDTTADNAFALAAYRQDLSNGAATYRFAYCLNRNFQKFYVDYADGPFRGKAASDVPMNWLPEHLALPLNEQAQTLRPSNAGTDTPAFLAHYHRQTRSEHVEYCLTSITRASSSHG